MLMRHNHLTRLGISLVICALLFGLPMTLSAAAITTSDTVTQPNDTSGWTLQFSTDKSQYLAVDCERPIFSVIVKDANGNPVQGAFIEFKMANVSNLSDPGFWWDSLAGDISHNYWLGWINTDANGFAQAQAKPICVTGDGLAYAVAYSGQHSDDGIASNFSYFTVVAGPPPPPPPPGSGHGGGHGCLWRGDDWDCPYLDAV